MTNTSFRGTLAAAALIAMATAGCTMEKQEPPSLTGPSEFAYSIAVNARPDIIVQDGASQSRIDIVARDANGQPWQVDLHLDVVVNGFQANDFGRLSAHNVRTGSDGSATVVYTAPPQPPDWNDPEQLVVIWVEPVGSNYDNTVGRSVSLRLVRPGTIIVPGAPFAEFTYSPSSPRVGVDVFFDAQTSRDGDGYITSYQWDYADGDRETGVTQLHDFPAPGTYNVTLTVTDNAGLRSSRTRIITVTP